MPIEAANFAGFSHAGAPPISRGSTSRAMPVAASKANIVRPRPVSRASAFQSVFILLSISKSLPNVASVNINIAMDVDIVNIQPYSTDMPRKTPHRYHHGDLSRALIQEAVRTIQKGGVETLT